MHVGVNSGQSRGVLLPPAAVLHHATLCRAMPCHAVPRCAALCHAVPCRATLCHAVPSAWQVAGYQGTWYQRPPAPLPELTARSVLARGSACAKAGSGAGSGAVVGNGEPRPPQPAPSPRSHRARWGCRSLGHPVPVGAPGGGRPGLALGSAGCNGGGPLQPGWGRRWVPPALPLLPAPRVEAAPALSCGFRWSLTPHKAPRSPFESEKGSERRALTFNLQVSPSTPLPPAPGTPPRAMPDRAKPWSPPEPGTGDGGRDRGWEQAAQAAPPLRYVGAGNCPSVPGVRQDLPHRSRLGSTAPPLLFRAGAAPQGLGKLSFDPAPQPLGTWGCPHFGGLLGGSEVVGVEGTGSLREGELHPCIPASLHPRISAALHLRSPALQPSLCPLHHHGSGY